MLPWAKMVPFVTPFPSLDSIQNENILFQQSKDTYKKIQTSIIKPFLTSPEFYKTNKLKTIANPPYRLTDIDRDKAGIYNL